MKQTPEPRKKKTRYFQDEVDLQQMEEYVIEASQEQQRNMSLLAMITKSKAKKITALGKTVAAAKPIVKKKNNGRENWHSFSEKQPAPALQKKYVAIDCQMVMCEKGAESISCLARVSVVDEKLLVLMDTFVKPGLRVKNYLTWVSGVTPAKLARAPSYAQIHEKLRKITAGAVIVGHSLQFDLKVLPGIVAKTLDIRDFGRFRSQTNMATGLKKLAERELGIRIQEGSHSSSEDARVTMQLFLKYRDEMIRELL